MHIEQLIYFFLCVFHKATPNKFLGSHPNFFFFFLTALKNRSMLEDTLNTLKLSCQTELNDIYIKYPNENQIVLGKNVGIKNST